MVGQTEHTVWVTDATDAELPEDSVDLVVTSPPYPMIEMWDELFVELDPEIAKALEDEKGMEAFELMHEQLDAVWRMVAESVVEGGFVCVNIGDATRTVDGSFQVFPNTTQVIETFRELGFHLLPRIYWNKPTNSATSFLGSGTLPPNAYPKLEHEHILIFRNGESKTFEPKADRRYESAYFFEERNDWFSDQWDSMGGVSQEFTTAGSESESMSRDRTGAFPLQLPYRLISMFSCYGDVVCDPFVGTGTTSVAAMLAGRDSVGIEIEKDIAELLEGRVRCLSEQSRELIGERIEKHQRYLQERDADGNPASYEASYYPFKVVTQQEKEIRFYEVQDAVSIFDSESSEYPFFEDEEETPGFRVTYEPYTEDIPVTLDMFD